MIEQFALCYTAKGTFGPVFKVEGTSGPVLKWRAHLALYHTVEGTTSQVLYSGGHIWPNAIQWRANLALYYRVGSTTEPVL